MEITKKNKMLRLTTCGILQKLQNGVERIE